MRKKLRQLFYLALAVVPAAYGVAPPQAVADGFTQYPGFDEIRASLSEEPPTATERQLLQRYRPVLYIAKDAEPPLDFYADYIAHGELRADGERFSNPSPAILNAHRDSPAAEFTHEPSTTATTLASTAYGGVSYAEINWPFVGRRRLTFLTYHFVFRQSGLPAGLGENLRKLADFVGDADDWHQLDHYTAVFIVLDGARLDGTRPFAVMLQQHNYMRTYLIGGKDFPTAANIRVDAAISSNELYPHRPNRTVHPAASFITPDTVDYLLGLEKSGGIGGAPDITDGQRQVNYHLQFLPPNDAFYVFEGRLGERRRLPGRDGPPGAIYRTLPDIWPPEISLYTFYYLPKDIEYADLVRANAEFWKTPETTKKLKQRFVKAWAERLPE